MTKKKKYGKVQVKNFKWIYAFLLPTIIIFVMFYVQPIAVMLDAYNIIYKMGWI